MFVRKVLSMNKKLIGTVATIVSTAFTAQAAGFALYGASAKGMAMGGAVVGKAVDGSANFYNPATISDFTNTVITVGTGLEAPSANVDVTSGGTSYSGRMNPGAFWLPHAYVVQPLLWDFSFGLGLAPEYGLGTEYSDNWPLNWNTTETTVQGFVVNPNLAYRVTDDWSVSAGFRIFYMTFEQYSRPIAANNGQRVGQVKTHLEGDNDFSDFGWQVSTRYKILDNLSFGLMYRSYIDTRVRGDYRTQVQSYDYSAVPGIVKSTTPAVLASKGLPNMEPYYSMVAKEVDRQAREQIRNGVDAGAAKANGDAGADIRLPQSIVAGLNWDITDTVHAGGAVTWTRWSSMDRIDFDLEGGNKTTKLNWDDVFRFGLAASWDFYENWALMGSYVYDIDPCQTDMNVGSTMLPPGDRHIGAVGLAWQWHGFEIAACYGLILMSGRDQKFSDETGRVYEFSSSSGISHQIGLTISYFF